MIDDCHFYYVENIFAPDVKSISHERKYLSRGGLKVRKRDEKLQIVLRKRSRERKKMWLKWNPIRQNVKTYLPPINVTHKQNKPMFIWDQYHISTFKLIPLLVILWFINLQINFASINLKTKLLRSSALIYFHVWIFI